MTQPWSLLSGGARMGKAVGREVTRPFAGVVAAGQRAGARLALDALDALLASTTAEVATDRVLASPWTERTVNKALTGSLVEVAARDIAEGAVLERVLDQVLATEVLDHIVDRAEEAGVVHRLAERVLADGIVEQAAERVLAGPELERLVLLTVESPAVERAIASVFESPLLDQVVDRLLASPELWKVVDEVARSPAVAEAVTHQGFGFADQVAGEVRDRSRSADAVVERTTRRLLRRRPRMDPPTGPLPNPGSLVTDRTDDYAGFVTRAIAFAIDIAIIDVAAAFVGIVVGLGLSALDVPDAVKTVAVAVGAVAFIAWSVGYFATFWSTTGQSPGARVMGIRVVCAHGDEPVGVKASIVRLVGMVLAAIPLCAGFLLILVDDRRRGLQDVLARTVVRYAPDGPRFS